MYAPPTEYGNDLATPFHTPITNLYSGQVIYSQCVPGVGGEVAISTSVPSQYPGPLTEYFLHLDTRSVGVGQTVQAGQQIGQSGGQLSGGSCPSTIQHSSGPHTEYGFGGYFAGPNINSFLSIIQARAGLIMAGTPPASACASATGSADSICSVCCGPVGSTQYKQCILALSSAGNIPVAAPTCLAANKQTSGGVGGSNWWDPIVAAINAMTAAIAAIGSAWTTISNDVQSFDTWVSSQNWADIGIRAAFISVGIIIAIVAIGAMIKDAA